jgi:hypothetical protein
MGVFVGVGLGVPVGTVVEVAGIAVGAGACMEGSIPGTRKTAATKPAMAAHARTQIPPTSIVSPTLDFFVFGEFLFILLYLPIFFLTYCQLCCIKNVVHDYFA